MENALPKDVVDRYLRILETGSQDEQVRAIGELTYRLSSQKVRDERIEGALVRAWCAGDGRVRAKAFNALKDLGCELPQAEVDKVLEDYAATPGAAKQKECPVCGSTLPEQRTSSCCPHCGYVTTPSRVTSLGEYPRVREPPEIQCFVPRTGTVVVAPASGAPEILYLVGQGDLLPVKGEGEGFYEVLLPGNESGYVEKGTGICIPLGAGEVREALGYVRHAGRRSEVEVAVELPDGTSMTVHSMGKDDRLPVVAERRNDFMVQLPSGVRGWVKKAYVTRTISPTSLPEVESTDLLSAIGSALGAVGIAALIGLAAIGGALTQDSEEAKMTRAVDKALQGRGL